MTGKEKVIDISRGRHWEAESILNRVYTCPSSWGGGEYQIERHYSGIILRSRKEFFEKHFSIHEIIVIPGADSSVVKKLKELVN